MTIPIFLHIIHINQIACLAIVGCASAALLPTFNQFEQAPVQHQSGAVDVTPIVKSESNINPDGSYSYEYETGNGIHVQESGVGGKQVQGSVSYVGQDGQPIQFSYVADENGFQPTGSHLPTPPPVPEAIGNCSVFHYVDYLPKIAQQI